MHSIGSRRQFVTKLGAAFAIVPASAVRGSQANSKITFALIGCGNRGTYDASIVAGDERAQFTVLCDAFDDRIENARKQLGATNAVAYRDYEKVLARDVDAVIIATPPFLHPPMLEAAVAARKHVYCEKPMGVDYEGCRRVIRTGRNADPKKNISAGFQQRYGPVYLEAFRRLKEGQIGDLVNARGFWIGQDPFKRQPYPDPAVEKLRNWFCYKDYSGDFIVEQDCHNFDVLHWFLEALPLRATGYAGRKVRTSMDLLDHLTLSFEWPNGIHVNFEANQMTPPGFGRVGEEFTGTKGVLRTSRGSLVHVRSARETETITSEGDITVDALKRFITRIQDGEAENVAERSALSTMIAILGRTALYTNQEVTWKGLYGG